MRLYIEKPDTQNMQFKPTGSTNHSKTRRLTGVWMHLATQDAMGRVFW